MSEPEQNSAEHALPSVRLNGWKEIALHLRKSVRTVQRWEKELGLPVHRIHTSRGEIIWADSREIDEWQTRTEDTQGAEALSNGGENGIAEEDAGAAGILASTNGQTLSAAELRRALWQKWRVALASFAVVIIAGSLILGIFIGRRQGEPSSTARKGQPASYRVEKNHLIVLNANSQILWTHTFSSLLAEDVYDLSKGADVGERAQIGDLDGDGTNEVAFIATLRGSPERDLFVFESDGKLRFRRSPGHQIRFGDGEKSPPFYAENVLMATGPGGQKTLWLAAEHNTWFPAVVEKISPDGKVLAEYWSNGHINELAETTWNGRKVILVGAMYNDKARASLAVLDYDNPSGSAPAMDPAYRCEDCPAGQPLLFYVFPRMELARALDIRPRITTLRVTPAEEIFVGVEHAATMLPGASEISYGGVFYTFDSQLSLKKAEPADSYQILHGKLELLGRLKHAYGARDDAELLPVLKWEGKKLVPIPLQRPAPTSLARFAGAPQ